MFLKTGQAGRVRIELEAPVCLERYKDHAQLGRFILRTEGKLL